jgi:hypothetical protein
LVSSWDDPAISDQDVLYRRFPKNHPDFLAVDSTGESKRLSPAALRYDECSGMSVSIGSFMDKYKVPRQELCDWNSHSIFEFKAGVPRSLPADKAGVVHDAVLGEQPMGLCHGLVKQDPAIPFALRKGSWKKVRAAVIERGAILEFRGIS